MLASARRTTRPSAVGSWASPSAASTARSQILRHKAERLAAMIDEATERRDHLEAHLAELDGGPDAHGRIAPRAPRRTRVRPEARRCSLDPTAISGLRAFSHRNYRLFFAGQAISLIGTWMQQVAQAWLVLTLTHDPIWLGVVVGRPVHAGAGVRPVRRCHRGLVAQAPDS